MSERPSTRALNEIFNEDRKKLKEKKINRRKFLKGAAKGVVQLGLIGAGVYGAVQYDKNLRGKIDSLEKQINGDKAFTYPKDSEYDMDTRMINDWMQIPNMVNSTYQILVETTYVDFDAIDKDGIPRKIEKKAMGTGILLPYGKVVTAGHVLQVDKKIKRSLFSLDKGDLTEVKYSLIIDGEKYPFDKIVEEVGEQDIGIGIASKLPDTVCWNGEMGDYHNLRRGNILYTVGHGLRLGERLRQGNYAGKVEGAFAHDGLLHLSEGANPGDSGGPIFAVKDGIFEYIGVLVSGVQYGGGKYLGDDITMFEGLEEKLLK